MCDGFHSKLNAALGRRHPTVFKVIEVFKDIDDSHEREIAQLRTGAAPKRRRRKYAEVDTTLTRLRHATFGGGWIPGYTIYCGLYIWMLPRFSYGTCAIEKRNILIKGITLVNKVVGTET